MYVQQENVAKKTQKERISASVRLQNTDHRRYKSQEEKNKKKMATLKFISDSRSFSQSCKNYFHDNHGL